MNNNLRKSICLFLPLSLYATNVYAHPVIDKSKEAFDAGVKVGKMSGHFHAICYAYTLAKTGKDRELIDTLLDSFIQEWMIMPDTIAAARFTIKRTIKDFKTSLLYSHTSFKSAGKVCAQTLENESRYNL